MTSLLPLLLACTTGSTPADDAAAPAAARVARAGEICINELMPDNESAAFDDQGDADDWIELHNPGAEALSLDGWSLSDDRDTPRAHALPDGLEIPAGGFLLLWADGDTLAGPDHLSFSLSSGGEEVGLFDPRGDGSVLAFGEVQDDFSVARQTDCCTGADCLIHDFRGTPGATNAPVAPTWEVVRRRGQAWRAYDQGGAVAPAGWTLPGFDDSAWLEGAAPLGYGDTHQRTVLSYGGNPSAKHITTWFRATADVPAVDDVVAARVRLLRDDGAVVYLNGVELGRSNMPDGDIGAATLARRAVGGADETALWTLEFSPDLLVAGENVLAVEVHQATADSSDLGFDLALELAR
ncbi:MAG: lamin tail domain-containing protein [Alphaproteobacteria bacterium]|nr:lamin tail domain-containing protein [Alphaproteobacteria bacterium]